MYKGTVAGVEAAAEVSEPPDEARLGIGVVTGGKSSAEPLRKSALRLYRLPVLWPGSRCAAR